MIRALPLLPLLVACPAEDRRMPPPPKPAPLPELVTATQMDLARDLDAAERQGQWTEVQHRWQGQVLRWEVTRIKRLCATPEQCHVVAFPVMRPEQRGWLPQVELAPGQFAALESACRDQESCKITIEGTLAELHVSSELPTRLKFSNVTIKSKTT